MARKTIIFPLALALLLPAAIAGAGMAPYRECRQCHSDIYKLWSNSLHGKAYSDPSFQAAYMGVMLDDGSDAAKYCLRCHAPLALLDDDSDPNSPAAAEGVGCSFCHSIVATRGGNIDTYYALDTSGSVYGPYRATDESAHDVHFSELHLEAELCAGCHEFTNDAGVAVLETYSEWKASPYPDNDVQCQNCHMPIMPELSIANGHETSDYYVTAHEFRGGHSRINLSHAVNLKTEVTREGRTLHVTVMITNAESGHKLPTGIPIRKLVLSVVMKTNYNVEVGAVRKVYRKTLTDKYGTIIENVPDMFLEARRIYSDNRIRPKETRVENFSFEIPEWVSGYNIETVLNYEYSRPILTEESVSVEMARNRVSSKNVK